ncbi:hypothetical protein [Tsukamurella sp. NPDC003166]|uniref:hypothetical protein n=1 Tax=Tsukamurella sp. NPDC003166 TaxID=3154444 RepID=UPI0033BF03B7
MVRLFTASGAVVIALGSIAVAAPVQAATYGEAKVCARVTGGADYRYEQYAVSDSARVGPFKSIDGCLHWRLQTGKDWKITASTRVGNHFWAGRSVTFRVQAGKVKSVGSYLVSESVA